MEKLSGQIMELFSPRRAYGPYFHKKEGRWIVMLRAPRDSGLKSTSISYARFKMSLRLGRLLKSGGEVDHIDDDKSNDVDENLQLLSPEANRLKYIEASGQTKCRAFLVHNIRCGHASIEDYPRKPIYAVSPNLSTT